MGDRCPEGGVAGEGRRWRNSRRLSSRPQWDNNSSEAFHRGFWLDGPQGEREYEAGGENYAFDQTPPVGESRWSGFQAEALH